MMEFFHTAVFLANNLFNVFWLLSSLLITCAHIFLSLDLGSRHDWVRQITDLAKPLYFYGKLKQTYVKKDAQNRGTLLYKIIGNLCVPKRWFCHFYLVGIAVHSSVFLLLILNISQVISVDAVLQRTSSFFLWQYSEAKGSLDQVTGIWQVVTVFACEELHLMRRLYECFFISSFANGTISVIHYFYGVAFYALFGSLDQVTAIWQVVTVFACEELHLIRRLYECFFISSFSNGTISVIHYFYGVAFYALFAYQVPQAMVVGFCILGIVIFLVASVYQHKALCTFANLRLNERAYQVPHAMDVGFCILGIVIFLVASVYQHKALCTFANLRLNERGKAAKGHYIPQGHLFGWVSSPHYLCEILIYLSFCTITQWKNMYLMCSTIFVIVNQVSASLSVHHWYRLTFPSYPKDRKALIPFVL
ncbi:polyprenol reductase-like [Plakobranchus ocellatus]|uniref:Polyprenal reductase n=1 Tax=Plakobranchus ocellatus TaxID=259542 RepID=A0AAV3YH67_9GAST|nr:polyprenol reductase-like [Plakobranchus ocellatus]